MTDNSLVISGHQLSSQPFDSSSTLSKRFECEDTTNGNNLLNDQNTTKLYQQTLANLMHQLT